jgi:lipid II:glycine glycyltransferase (peptidoglycan interpeptide bridge formation enzyme)
LYFQSRGLATYDLGGWAGDGGDRTLRGVDAFKEGFGGRVAREFNCTVANSARGVAILALRRLRPARVRPGRAWRERTPRSGP